VNKRPDFICIGPEKTAATWLFRVLEQHPQVWLPPYKELRFLTEGNLVPEHTMRNVFFSQHWHCKELRRILMRSTAKFFLRRSTGNFDSTQAYLWVLHYMFGKHSFDWYDSLFKCNSGLLCGDVTPNYYHIPEQRIKELFQHNPQTKILLFVRNPIERAWSAALMNYCQHENRRFEDVSESEWITMLDDIYQLWVPYTEVIARWEKYFPDMHIAFFDQLKNEPEKFYDDISCFLGIEPHLGNGIVSKVIGKGVGKVMPEPVRQHLTGQYEQEIQRLVSDEISDYPQEWL